MIKNRHLLNKVEEAYLEAGVLRAYFVLRKQYYMLTVIFGDEYHGNRAVPEHTKHNG